jgi:hypothetical protein
MDLRRATSSLAVAALALGLALAGDAMAKPLRHIGAAQADQRQGASSDLLKDPLSARDLSNAVAEGIGASNNHIFVYTTGFKTFDPNTSQPVAGGTVKTVTTGNTSYSSSQTVVTVASGHQ